MLAKKKNAIAEYSISIEAEKYLLEQISATSLKFRENNENGRGNSRMWRVLA